MHSVPGTGLQVFFTWISLMSLLCTESSGFPSHSEKDPVALQWPARPPVNCPLVASLTPSPVAFLFSHSARLPGWFGCRTFEPLFPSAWDITTDVLPFLTNLLRLWPPAISCTLSLLYFLSYHLLSVNILYELFIVFPPLENKLYEGRVVFFFFPVCFVLYCLVYCCICSIKKIPGAYDYVLSKYLVNELIYIPLTLL